MTSMLPQERRISELRTVQEVADHHHVYKESMSKR